MRIFETKILGRVVRGAIIGMAGCLLLGGCKPSGESPPPAADVDPDVESDIVVATAVELPDPSGYAAVFYVSPEGDDANAGTSEKPFASLEAARDAVRTLPAEERTADVLVWVAPGDYPRSEPFVLRPEDSGTEESRIIYRGGGEPGSARLLGGVSVKGWESLGDGIFRADVSSLDPFHTLYENGIRARKARFPNYEFDPRFPTSGWRYLNAEGGTNRVLTWKEGDLAEIDVGDLGDQANLVFWPWGYADWHKVTRRIDHIDPEKREIRLPDNKTKVAIGKQARYYIEGARSLLDQPGEFYLDEKEGTLYYWPRFGDPDEQEIFAPILERIVFLDGGSVDEPVQHVVVEGFEMAYTDTFGTMVGLTHFPWSVSTGYGNNGIVHLRYTENVEVLYNHIRSAGLNGIYLDRSNKYDRIHGNWIEDMGISGICIAYHRERRDYPRDVNEFNMVSNNLIHRVGLIGVDAFGINVWGASNNTLTHNEIFDSPRYAVTMRGPYTQIIKSGGKAHDTNRPRSVDNVISYSYFYNVGQDSGDMGAIHMAGICSEDDFPSNTIEQVIISDIEAHPSMQDIKPNGIFFDYPGGVTDQVLRDVEIRNTGVPFRTNRTDIRHTYDNVSWRDGFDPSRMEYDRIGLTDDFPGNFRDPSELAEVTVEEVGGEPRTLRLTWRNPSDGDLVRVRIDAEGVADYPAVVVAALEGEAVIPRPAVDRLVNLRIQTVDGSGNFSQGVLVPAAELPVATTSLSAEGIASGVRFSWECAENPAGFILVTGDSNVEDVRLDGSARVAEVAGLVDARTYEFRLDTVDGDGFVWPGPVVRASAGEGVPIPLDAAAWWRFDEDAVWSGLSIGDASGNGHTLFVADKAVGLTDGRFGRALSFDGADAYARVLAPEPLAIGTGDFAVSFWVRQGQTINLTERTFEFGGTGEPGLSIMVNPTDVRLLFTAGEKRYGPYYRGLDMVGAWHHVVVNVIRDEEISIWVDGEKLVAESISDTAGIDIPAADYLHLGRFKNNDDPRYNWTGDLDQLRIYQRGLDPAEIIALSGEGVSE